MKKVALTVDLDNNELFENEMRNAVRGYAKEIARSELDKSINEEIHRIVNDTINKKLKPPQYGQITYAGDLYKRIYAAASSAIESLAHSDVQNIINTSIASKASDDYDQLVNEKIAAALSAAKEDIISEVRTLMKSEILKILIEGKNPALTTENELI